MLRMSLYVLIAVWNWVSIHIWEKQYPLSFMIFLIFCILASDTGGHRCIFHFPFCLSLKENVWIDSWCHELPSKRVNEILSPKLKRLWSIWIHTMDVLFKYKVFTLWTSLAVLGCLFCHLVPCCHLPWCPNWFFKKNPLNMHIVLLWSFL